MIFVLAFDHDPPDAGEFIDGRVPQFRGFGIGELVEVLIAPAGAVKVPVEAGQQLSQVVIVVLTELSEPVVREVDSLGLGIRAFDDLAPDGTEPLGDDRLKSVVTGQNDQFVAESPDDDRAVLPGLPDRLPDGLDVAALGVAGELGQLADQNLPGLDPRDGYDVSSSEWGGGASTWFSRRVATDPVSPVSPFFRAMISALSEFDVSCSRLS